VGLVGLGALATMAACSDSTDAGSGGAGGSVAAGGSHSGGKASTAGGAGTGGGSLECGFATEECQACLTGKCEDQVNACSEAGNCLTDLLALPNCVCVPSNDPSECIGEFVSKNGDPAQKLAECYTLNCEDLCQ